MKRHRTNVIPHGLARSRLDNARGDRLLGPVVHRSLHSSQITSLRMLSMDDGCRREQWSPKIILVFHMSADYRVDCQQTRILLDQESDRPGSLGWFSWTS